MLTLWDTANGELDPQLANAIPVAYRFIAAAESLGCSVFELMARPDADYWLTVGNIWGRFKAEAQERAYKN